MSPSKKKGGAKARKAKKPAAPAAREFSAKQERVKAQVDLGLESVESLTVTEESPPPAEQVASFNFSEFFQKVGQGLVNAQRKMDAESLTYLQEVSVQPHVLPSIFRIPKLSANVKFAWTKESDQGFSIIFYKDESKDQTLNQQSVEFDIVSVPAPLQLNSPVGINVVLSKTDRQAILEEVRAYQLPGVSNTQAQLGLQGALANPDRILIYVLSPDQVFYIAYADNQKDENVGFWFMTRNPTQVFAIRKFGEPGAAGLGAFNKAVRTQGDAQAKFLNEIRV